MNKTEYLELNKRLNKETVILVFNDKKFMLCTKNRNTILLLSNEIKFDYIDYNGIIEVADLVNEEAKLVKICDITEVLYLGEVGRQKELDSLIDTCLGNKEIYK